MCTNRRIETTTSRWEKYRRGRSEERRAWFLNCIATSWRFPSTVRRAPRFWSSRCTKDLGKKGGIKPIEWALGLMGRKQSAMILRKVYADLVGRRRTKGCQLHRTRLARKHIR